MLCLTMVSGGVASCAGNSEQGSIFGDCGAAIRRLQGSYADNYRPQNITIRSITRAELPPIYQGYQPYRPKE
ncbi:uncharacterized protein DFL_004463 [Arthrobotrys flagrans]|uniref:Uncharacterized protein n=1 Tax=Arthrobotrys flagrans TaxID=97331 RepID=A0A437A4Z6_ARTFL|nr:hypothetical protein DFL_004463 [Arthrobotrys flagrans]